MTEHEDDPYWDVGPISPSVQSDLDMIDKAIKYIGEQCMASVDENYAWKQAEPILGTLEDARSAILFLQKRLNDIEGKQGNGKAEPPFEELR
jgi:hypothetical protein